MFYDKITICHSAVKVSCLVCYTVILKLHIMDSKKEAHVSGNLFIPHSYPLRAKFAKFPVIPYVYVISATFVCMDMCFQYFMHAYVRKYMHAQYTFTCMPYVHTYVHAHTCSDEGKWQNQVRLIY